MQEERPTFTRSLTLADGLALAISFVVGSGLLGLPGIVLEAVGPRYSVLSWVITSLAMTPLVLVFSSLGSHFPSSSGLLSYAEYGLGRGGRNAASLMLLSCFPFGMPALLMIGGAYLQVLFGVSESWLFPLALLILAVSVGFNWAGIKSTTEFNFLSMILLVIFIVLLTVLKTDYFVAGTRLAVTSLVEMVSGAPLDLSLLWKGSTLVFWAFLGWENLSFGVQEFKDPKRSVRLIFGSSFVIVTLLYFALAFTSAGAAVSGFTAVSSTACAISLLDGLALKPLCLVVIVFLIMGNTNAWVYASSRLFFAEAKEGILPRSLAVLSPRQVPVKCLRLSFFGTVACLLAYWVTGLSVASLILVVTQNFLFLFLMSIFAYAKAEKSKVKYVVIPAALAACSLFLSGFTAWVLFPLSLISAGYLLSRFR